MKVKCSGCGMMVRIDETKHEPGTETYIPCPRCRAPIHVIIPGEPLSDKASSDNDHESAGASRKTPEKVIKQPQDVSNDQPKPRKKRKPAKPKKQDADAPATHADIPAKSSRQDTSSVQVESGGAQNDQASKSNDGCGCGCLVIVFFILGVFAIIWALRSCSGSSDKVAEGVTDSVKTEILEEDPVYDNRQYSEEVAVDSPIAETSDEVKGTIVPQMGFHLGSNDFEGDMIHTDGRRFPFTLKFFYDPESGEISNVTYENIESGTKLKLKCGSFDGSFIRLAGMDGKKEFIIQFEGDGPYVGDAWWGDFHQDIELTLN